MRHARHRSISVLFVLAFATSAVIIPALPAQALQCYEDCVPDPTAPSPPSPGAPQPPGNKVTVSGTVVNAQGVPIVGASVYSSWASAVTSSSGAYSLLVLRDSPTTLYAVHTLYAFQSKTTQPPVNPLMSINFSLRYLLNTDVSPEAFNSVPQTLTFSVYSTASTAGSKALVQFADGSASLQLQLDTSYVNPHGWARWTGTRTLGTGLPDARKTFYACILDPLTGSTCWSPPTEPSGLLSQVKSSAYALDRVSPLLSPLTPLDGHNTTARRPPLSVLVTDTVSHPDPENFVLRIDGTVVPATAAAAGTSGSITYIPFSDLPLGVHSISASAADSAGNQTTVTWRVNVVALTASSAQVTLEESAVPVTSSSVTFAGTKATLDSYELTLSSSAMWAGRGAGSRSSTFSHLTATFENELGQQIRTTVSPRTVEFPVSYAVLAPEPNVLTAHIPQATVTLAPISVQVPTGFLATAQSKATLSLLDAAGNSVAEPADAISSDADPLPIAIGSDCAVTARCSISGLISCEVESATSGVMFGCNGTYPTVFLNIEGEAPIQVPLFGSTSTFEAASEAESQSTTYNAHPHPNPAPPHEDLACRTADYSCDNIVYPNNDVGRLFAYWRAGELFKFYGHQYFFKIEPLTNGSRSVVVWQTSDVTSGETAGLRACLMEAGNVIETPDDSLAFSNEAQWAPSGDGSLGIEGSHVPERQSVLLDAYEAKGFRVGGTTSTSQLDLTTVRSSTGLLQGRYGKNFGTVVRGVLDGAKYRFEKRSGTGGVNTWLPNSARRLGHAEIMTGAQLAAPSSQFKVVASGFFAFTIQGSACA